MSPRDGGTLWVTVKVALGPERRGGRRRKGEGKRERRREGGEEGEGTGWRVEEGGEGAR